MTPPLFTVSYDDEDYLFGEGDRRRFGRDDSACAIPLWEEIRRTAVSKVAGELWCMDGEMWLRNLSSAHELEVTGPDGPPQYLPARSSGERGAARSLPVPVARIAAPSTGSWTLAVRRLREVECDAMEPTMTVAVTSRLGPVPTPLRLVAAALCRPVLTAGRPAASYEEIGRTLGVTPRQARRRVEELVGHYRGQLPELTEDHRHSEPLYTELARLLVRRRCVTGRDLDDLGVVPT